MRILFSKSYFIKAEIQKDERQGKQCRANYFFFFMMTDKESRKTRDSGEKVIFLFLLDE
jgi:hypothetical protein